jgi:hypothetical protein
VDHGELVADRLLNEEVTGAFVTDVETQVITPIAPGCWIAPDVVSLNVYCHVLGSACAGGQARMRRVRIA